jgi:predicted nucleic acid-binding protein
VTQTVYLDSSAIVKLLVREPQSDALQDYLRGQPSRAVSRVATVEVQRAIGRIRGLDAAAIAVRLRQVLDGLILLEFDAGVAAAAARLQPATTRTLDAIHLASAMELHDDLVAIVTYDKRMRDAATSLGLPTAAPT